MLLVAIPFYDFAVKAKINDDDDKRKSFRYFVGNSN